MPQLRLQICDFLEADAAWAIESFCAALVRGHPNAAAAWKLLKDSNVTCDHLRNLILAQHPALASGAPLATIMPQLPRTCGLAAVRSRCHFLHATHGDFWADAVAQAQLAPVRKPCAILQLA